MNKFRQINFARRVTNETYLNINATYIAKELSVNKSSIIKEDKRKRHKTSSDKCVIGCVYYNCLKLSVYKVKGLCEYNYKNYYHGYSLSKE